MKRKISKILGVGLAVMLLASLLLVAVPVSANVSAATVDVTPDEISELDPDYVITFDLGKDLEVSDTITITFPDDTVITPAAVAATLAASPGWVAGTWDSVSTATATFVGNADDLTIIGTVATEPIGEGATVRIEITAGITSPTEPGDYTLTVKTTDETTTVESQSYSIDAPVVGGFVYVYNPSEILMATFGGSGALDAATAEFDKEGYTIVVGSGTYLLGIDLQIAGKGVIFESSEGAADTIIDADGNGIQILTGGEDVVIDGFTIDDADIGVSVDEDDATVKNCVITDATAAGVSILDDGTDATVSDNTIEDCATGILFAAGGVIDLLDVDITGNTITEANTLGGIVLGGGEKNVDITANTITGNETSGITFATTVAAVCDDIKIDWNIISANEGSGIRIATTVAPTKLVITKNDILDNEVDGLLIDTWDEDLDYIMFNNIYDNEDDNVDNDSAVDISARFNWWGTAVEDDFDGELEGDVDYEPWLADTHAATASGSSVTASADASTSLDAKTTAGVIVSGMDDDSGDGAYIISAAKYVENPQDAIDDAIGFYDVFAAYDDTLVALDFTEITGKVKFYDTTFTATSVAYFWTGDFWAKCSEQESRSGLVWVTVTEDTTPTLEELEGTEFVVISTPFVPPILTLKAPQAGADTLLTNVPFTWSSVADATSYFIMISPNADMSKTLVAEVCAGTAYTLTETLTDATPYYWQVLAKEDATTLAQSDLGTFIAKTPVEAVVPEVTVEVEAPAAPEVTVEVAAPPAPEVTVEVPAAEAPATPTYIWVIIAVGAILVIALIVLIVRTRRVV